jgi:hypothetical protein
MSDDQTATGRTGAIATAINADPTDDLFGVRASRCPATTLPTSCAAAPSASHASTLRRGCTAAAQPAVTNSGVTSCCAPDTTGCQGWWRRGLTAAAAS